MEVSHMKTYDIVIIGGGPAGLAAGLYAGRGCTYVLGMYSEKGTLDPTNKTKIVWGVLMAALAAATV